MSTLIIPSRLPQRVQTLSQVLQQESSGSAAVQSMSAQETLSQARRGYLHCQLQMGHLQGMLTQVDGFAQSAAGAAHPSSPLTFLRVWVNALVAAVSLPYAVLRFICAARLLTALQCASFDGHTQRE